MKTNRKRDTNDGKRIVVRKDGPYVVHGDIPLVRKAQVVSEHGEPLTWQKGDTIKTGKTYTLCRCGESSRRPFCDGAHARAHFDGTESADTRVTAERQVIYDGGTNIVVRRDDYLCTGSGFCANRVTDIEKMVPDTHDTQVRAQVMAMIDRCPSGSFVYSVEEGEADIEPDLPRQIAVTTEITWAGPIVGPLWVTGNIPVERADGQPFETRNRVTLCRCGLSGEKPLCDGTHRGVGVTEEYRNGRSGTLFPIKLMEETTMNEWDSRMAGILDGHVHMRSMADEASMLRIREATGIAKMTLVSIQNPEAGAGLAQSLYMKARHPKLFFVFAGLNHAEKLSGGRVKTPSLAEQAEGFVEMGCDGIKMIEGKPTSRQRMDIPVTDPYFAHYWARVEELGMPIVWHVNDPEEFWDPDGIPGWAKERNWGYGPDDVQKEQLYAEVDQVLTRHPNLRIILAHFYFLSADLARAGRFFDEHPTVHFDLAPGIEMLYNLSHDPSASRAFFIQYADHIVFGTDLSSSQTVEEGRIRAGIVYRWLESEDTFRVPEAADFLLGPPEDGLIRGMSLPDDVLTRIYHDNLSRLVGSEPRALNVERAVAECERLAAIAKALSGKPAAETEAALVARHLAHEG